MVAGSMKFAVIDRRHIDRPHVRPVAVADSTRGLRRCVHYLPADLSRYAFVILDSEHRVAVGMSEHERRLVMDADYADAHGDVLADGTPLPS